MIYSTASGDILHFKLNWKVNNVQNLAFPHVCYFFSNTVKLCNHCYDDHAAQYTFFLKPVSKPQTIGCNEDV